MTGDTTSRVLAHVRKNPGTSPADVAAATGLSRDTAKKAMQRAAAAGTLRSDGRGHYYATRRRHLSPVPSPDSAGDMAVSSGDGGGRDHVDGDGTERLFVNGEVAERWTCDCCGAPEQAADRCEWCGWPERRPYR